MNSHLAAHANYPADRRGSYDETTLRNESAGLAARRLTRRASLMLALYCHSLYGRQSGRPLAGWRQPCWGDIILRPLRPYCHFCGGRRERVYGSKSRVKSRE
jgi:hypothetical protein